MNYRLEREERLLCEGLIDTLENGSTPRKTPKLAVLSASENVLQARRVELGGRVLCPRDPATSLNPGEYGLHGDWERFHIRSAVQTRLSLICPMSNVS